MTTRSAFAILEGIFSYDLMQASGHKCGNKLLYQSEMWMEHGMEER